MRLSICMSFLCAVGAGCINERYTDRPATMIDPATTQPSFWLDQPGSAIATSSDFDRLFHACEAVARDYLFKLDRVDYRSGVLTTVPVVSGQLFEPWRRDTPTAYDVEESSIATIRRSIRFEITRENADTWTVSPKVLVERMTISERRITSATMYRAVFVSLRDAAGRSSGSREADQGIVLPERYWYPLRRDVDFERAIASAVQKKLGA